jgi:hypothetical protein
MGRAWCIIEIYNMVVKKQIKGKYRKESHSKT